MIQGEYVVIKADGTRVYLTRHAQGLKVIKADGSVVYVKVTEA